MVFCFGSRVADDEPNRENLQAQLTSITKKYEEGEKKYAEANARLTELEAELTRRTKELQSTITIRHPDAEVPKIDIKEISPDDNASSALLHKLKEQIQVGLRQRDEAHIHDIFTKHSVGNPKVIPKDSLFVALTDLGVSIEESNVDQLLYSIDTLNDGSLDKEEFRRVALLGTPLTQWASSLPLSQLLADSLPLTDSKDLLRALSRLSDSDVDTICEAFCWGMKKILREDVQRLKKSFDEMDKMKRQPDNASTKFEVFKMSCGTIKDFFGGLGKRIGQPHLEFEKAMEAEHCNRGDSLLKFITSNYKVETCPSDEWDITVRGNVAKADVRHGRIIQDLDVLMKTELVSLANISRFEVMAVVLYTGPMFAKYNMVLRRWPIGDYQKQVEVNNFYTTTIHVLVSAVEKVARVMKLAAGTKLYRGVGGLMDLPDCFFKADDFGCRGYVEWGFMSTTSDKSVAIRYSGLGEGRPIPMVIEVEVGSVDRGACIRDLSQYPQEVEFLWVPCSFLAPVDAQRIVATDQGVFRLVGVRINANLTARTVEELLGQKRDLHLAAFRYAIDEIGRDLEALAVAGDAPARLQRDPSRSRNGANLTVDGLVVKITARCQEVFDRHQAFTAEEFLDDNLYRSLVAEMLHTKAAALETLRHWLDDDSRQIFWAHAATLKTARRAYLGFLTRTLFGTAGEERERAAERLCKITGLMRSSVDEADDLGHTPILSASADGAPFRLLQMLVAARADPHARDKSGRAPVYLAASYGQSETIEALHKLGADVNAAAANGNTPTWIAADNGHAEAVEALCRLGANVNRAAKDGRTPLYAAAQSGHAAAAEALVRCGADMGLAAGDGMTPLHVASQEGHATVVEALGRLKADLAAEAKGGTALALAVSAGKAGAAEVLRGLCAQ